MTTAPLQSPFRRIFEEAFNQGNLAVVDEVYAAGYVAHIAQNGATHSPQGVKWWIAMLRNAFPDLYCTIEDEIHAGDKYAAHWRMRGTQKGLFLGNVPTGRQMEIQGIIFVRMENGRVIEDWTLIDQLGILQQLGLIPPGTEHEAHSRPSIDTKRT